MTKLAATPLTRGHRHECGSCGRAMQKAKRMFGDIPFCDTCYAREFLRRPCSKCSEPTMLHKSQQIGICRKCERLDWKCLRCEKPVERAALLVGGKPVCPSCRRYFEPYPVRKKPKDHARCTVCGKSRRIEKRDAHGNTLCKPCATYDRRAEVAAKDNTYWVAYLATRQVKLSKTLTSNSSRDLFSRFVEAEFQRTPSKTLALKLKHHFAAFQQLEKRLPDIGTSTQADFLEQFTGQEMRRWETVFAFLKADGLPVPARESRELAADLRRIETAVASVSQCHDGFRVVAFAKYLENPTSGKKTAVKTQRVSIRAAVGLVQVFPSDALSQAAVTKYLKQSPGQRAALAAFLGFLRTHGIQFALPPKRPAKRGSPSKMKDLDACIAVLRRSRDFGQLRAALAGALVGLFGVNLVSVLALPRTAVTTVGKPTLDILGQTVAVDERLVPGFLRYLESRDQHAGGTTGPLFPGRVAEVSIDPSSLGYHFSQWGVSPRNLRVSGKAFLARI